MAEPRDGIGSSGPGAMSIFRIILGLIELWLVAMVLILGCAFIMSLLGANPEAGFSSWIYARTSDIMRPFNGIFDPIELTGETSIQTSLLFAMFVYGAVAAVLDGVAKRFFA